jgi:rubredoxin
MSAPFASIQSQITCPLCHYKKTETIPMDFCVYLYECTACRAVLKPNSGDCCIFCSFGTIKCPYEERHFLGSQRLNLWVWRLCLPIQFREPGRWILLGR